MMHGPEKSDPAIVAGKPTNKVERSAAELVERRAGGLVETGKDVTTAVLGVAALLCAYTTFHSTAISSFLKIFVGIFSTETIVFGLAVLAGRAGLWPADYTDYLPPESLPLTVAIFSILVYLVEQSGM